MTIKILDRLTAEQIAAGEVIENPASVIKELVENSLDAGSSRIEVRYSNGGRDSLIVIDNGCGIAPAELPLAFQRFATSKLTALDDLGRITSLGFRGEALPSIAAIARVTLTSRQKGALAGSRISLAGGSVISQEEFGAPEGTAVEVNDLFYNTPGRLKFLRSAAAESGRITALLTNLVLAHPDTAFILANESKTLLQTAGDGNLLHVIGAVYGSECAAAMLPLREELSETGLAISGLISAPHYHRSSRRQVTVIVNGRVINSFQVTGALERGYGSYMPRQRYPVAVLHLNVAPELLDINVHPAKSEVRFAKTEAIKDLVFKSVRAALRQPLPESRGSVSRPYDDEPFSAPGNLWPEHRQTYFLESAAGAASNPEPFTRASTLPDIPARKTDLTDFSGPMAITTGAGSCSLIGQFLYSYLIVQRGEELLLIDQHAAHERILYESLAPETSPQERPVQLTIPCTIEVPLSWREPLDQLLPVLLELGFNLEPFGDNSYIIRAVPYAVGAQLSGVELHTLLEELIETKLAPGESRREQIRKTVACHRAVKANQPLTEAEMRHLLDRWESTPGARYCPHGRPAVIGFKREDLEKGFRRRGESGENR